MKPLLTESPAAKTVQDFEQFCTYIHHHRPVVTSTGNLPPKVCFELNQCLSIQEEDDAKPTDKMGHYLSVGLWLHIGLAAGIIGLRMVTKKKSSFVVIEEFYDQFQSLTVFSKYALLFQTWICFVDMEEVYGRGSYIQLQDRMLLERFFIGLDSCKTNQWIVRDQSVLAHHPYEPIQLLMHYHYKVAQALANFQLVDCETTAAPPNIYEKKVISRLRPTDFGKLLIHTFKPTIFAEYSRSRTSCVDFFAPKPEEPWMAHAFSGKTDFLDPLLSVTPPDVIDLMAIDNILFQKEYKGLTPVQTRYEFKVSITTTCSCTIVCGGQHTFEELHRAIQYAFDFDDDHLYSFYLDGKNHSSYSIHSPYAQEPPRADKVCIGNVRLLQNQHILYLFDYGDCWYFWIELIKSMPSSDILLHPTTDNFVGEAPPQYGY